MQAQPHMNRQGWLMLFAVSIIWALSFLLVEIALAEVPPITIMTARVSIGSVGLYAMLRIAGGRVSVKQQVPRAFVLGAFLVLGLTNNVIPFSLIVWGQTHVSASLASILNATMPLFVVFLAHFFTTDEKLTSNKMFGVLTGIAGVIIIVSEHGVDIASGSSLGKLAVLGAAFSYAVAALIARRFAALQISPLLLAFGQSAAASAIAVPLALIVDTPFFVSGWQTVGVPVWAVLAMLGLVCSSLAYLLYFRLIASAGATNASLVTLAIPPLAVVLGVMVLDETLSGRQFAGMVAILLGLVVTDGRLPGLLWLRMRAGKMEG